MTSKVLQKQLAMAMQEMIEDTGSTLAKKMETLRQIINFALSMCDPESEEGKGLQEIRDTFSTLIKQKYSAAFDDPDVTDSTDEILFRMCIEDLHGDASRIINDHKLVPAWMMEQEEIPTSETAHEGEEII